LLWRWQNITVLDFDTKPRDRKLILTIIGQ
jgi:thiamine phosphate synthase YjbQ (UPF0047 family)